jgi:acetyl-CoA synthetase
VDRIRKRLPLAVAPNLGDYDATVSSFSWDDARRAVEGLPGGRGLNIAHAAVDRHVAAGHGDRCAIRAIDREGDARSVTFDELRRDTNRFANTLAGLGVETGERVFVLLPRGPGLHTAVLGALKHRAVVCPLFPAFGPEPIRQRLALGDGRVLVTTPQLYDKKVRPVVDELPGLEHVLVADDVAALVADSSDDYEIGPTDPEDMALLHFTSGTTGLPKGAVHVHEAIVAHHATAAFALDLHPDDVFWCTADPGWVTGMSYGVLAPLSHGITSVVDEREFDAGRWYDVLERERVTVWYTAPTAIRRLMRTGRDLPADHDLSALRFVASVGEPLNPEAVVWGSDVLGLPIHDNWWQTETGGIMIANFASTDIKPGSMGRPVPGVTAAILARDQHGAVRVDDDGDAVVVDAPDVEGHLALRRGWPSMFRGYLGDDDRYRRCFVGDWYVTGDLARRDADGWFWFVGRADDVIKSAGHLIGPFEVESALMEHPAVAEAGVIGVPDDIAGEVVKAFVSLHDGWDPTEELSRELIGFARKKLGAAVAPRSIAFDQHLPKTRSGKIMRRLLKARELGLATGDVSTLEEEQT